MAFIIAQITDTHLSPNKPFFHDNFTVVVEELRKDAPHLVINTGDVSLNGADLLEDLVGARDMHEAIGLPWLAIPGNHDIGDNQETATKQPTNSERRERWLEVFGDDYWFEDVPGWRLVGINSLLLGSDIPEAEEQESFIEGCIHDLEDRKLALFLHKPLFHDTLEDTEVSGHAVNPDPRRRLVKALSGVKPALVCCGHLHEHRERDHNGLYQAWAPAVSFTLSEEFLPNHGGVHTVGYLRIALEADGTFEIKLIQPEGIVEHDLLDFPDAYGDLRKLMAARAVAE